MESREDIVQLISAKKYEDIEAFTGDLVKSEYDVRLNEHWSLKWFQKRCTLLAVNEKSKVSYCVCFFAGCQNEIRPGNFCDHVREPATLSYSQTVTNFKKVVHEAMKICKIPELDTIFAYNMMIKILKEKADHKVHVEKYKLDIVLDGTESSLAVKIADKCIPICSFPGCFLQSIGYSRIRHYNNSLYCIHHISLQYVGRGLGGGKALALLFKRVVMDVAMRLNENVDTQNTEGWKRILGEFVQFDEGCSFYIPYWHPGNDKQSTIQVIFNANGQLEIMFQNKRTSVCNQPFCFTETVNTRALKFDENILDPSVFRCSCHAKDFALKGEFVMDVYKQSAFNWLKNQGK